MRISLIALLAFTISSGPAFAACEPGVIGDHANVFNVKKVTGYIPKLGGINGAPGKSASGADASFYSYERYMKGGSEVVMVAIPQLPHAPGKRSKYFKSIVRIPAIEKKVGKCVMFFAGDHYGKSSNWAGEFGKIDMVHEPPYKNAMLFNELRNSPVYIMSGPQMVRGKRIIFRDPKATAAPMPFRA